MEGRASGDIRAGCRHSIIAIEWAVNYDSLLGCLSRDRQVLITSGLGFIGSNLGHRLVELVAEILLVDSLILDYDRNLFNIHGIENHVRVNIADMCDENAMRYLVQGQDYLFNPGWPGQPGG